MAVERCVNGTKMLRSRFLEISRINTGGVKFESKVCQEQKLDYDRELLRKNSRSRWPYFLETFMGSRRVKGVNCYSVFKFELLQNLHLVISKLMKKCTVNYLSPERVRAGEGAEGMKVVC